ncbi:hypothetical protein [Cohnella silvisoli]|uniref:Uncharacterized protein n=1 Tax=Cohnella silvisoli TaxID=2873699 RepID=A0ABV1L339_9BACL|nr:hypothetical protein [Cohnella silvisoli]MCD9026067.1 hypothetical protein [Cohnella silvisoli]
MNPISMIRRITEHVTHIGFEMRMIDGMRKLARVGEFEWRNGVVAIRDLIRYEESTGRWIFPESFSERALRKISRTDSQGYRSISESAKGESVSC